MSRFKRRLNSLTKKVKWGSLQLPLIVFSCLVPVFFEYMEISQMYSAPILILVNVAVYFIAKSQEIADGTVY